MNQTLTEEQRLARRWDLPASGDAYAHRRWGSKRRENRDAGLIRSLLGRHASNSPLGRILDVPCGTGRLRPFLASRGTYVALDASSSMLRQVDCERRALGSAWRLPLADHSVDVVVCCRLLHHVRDADERRALIGELSRVSRGLVLASFWDAASWHALRRRAGWRRASHPDSRVAIDRRVIADEFDQAGARPLGFAHSLRWVSPQTFLAARVAGRDA